MLHVPGTELERLVRRAFNDHGIQLDPGNRESSQSVAGVAGVVARSAGRLSVLLPPFGCQRSLADVHLRVLTEYVKQQQNSSAG